MAIGSEPSHPHTGLPGCGLVARPPLNFEQVMMMPRGRNHALAAILAATLAIVCSYDARAEDAPTAEQLEFFEKKIRPVLVENCYECHSAESDEVQGNLRVDHREGLLSGGSAGAAVVPGDPDASLLIQAVRYVEDAYQMPPAGKLPDEVIRDLEEWVKMGAPDPRRETGEPTAEQTRLEEQKNSHWAFQPPRVAPRPSIQNTAWPRDELDVYLLGRLEPQGISPSPDAERRVLIRRVYMDLLGLPPTFQQVEAFVADSAPDAYERLVDSLLTSPQFGERWARHWLDVSRYSDTKGYVFLEDRSYPEAYTYRDWLIQTINRDLPYDQFLKYQLAADQLPPLEWLNVNTQAAMGYLTLGRRFLNNKHDIIDDRIDVVTRGMLGLTVTCARCHDHKYDPIPIEDYYSLYGVFSSSDEPKNEPSTLRLVDSATPEDAPVLLRGNARNQGDVVPRQFLEVLSGPERRPFQQGSGRLELAEAIASPDNPLTSRVMVNRVWLHLFGNPLVGTPSDFGTRSDAPLQPEVLDVLAVRFVEDGWSLKKLVRRIVLSSAYRQSSAVRSDAAMKDPENRLVWRQNRRRMDLEALRDAILASAEQMEPVFYGTSVDITAQPFARRRTVYAYIDRQNLPNLFRTFDFASPDTHSPLRLETTTPQQSLFLMNHPFVLEQCQKLCETVRQRVTADCEQAGKPVTDNDLIEQFYCAVLARRPSEDELKLMAAYVAEAQAEAAGSSDQMGTWEKLVQVLYLSNEFQFID